MIIQYNSYNYGCIQSPSLTRDYTLHWVFSKPRPGKNQNLAPACLHWQAASWVPELFTRHRCLEYVLVMDTGGRQLKPYN